MPSTRPRRRTAGSGPGPGPPGAEDTGVLVVLTTVGGAEKAESIAAALVEERLAACVSLVPGVRSVYRWKGDVCRDDEVLLLIKTTAAIFDLVDTRLRELHPYECPEVLALAAPRGSRRYVEWVGESVRDRTRLVEP